MHKPVPPRSVTAGAQPRPVPRAPKPVPAPPPPAKPKAQPKPKPKAASKKPKQLYGVYAPPDEILQLYWLSRSKFDTICRLLDGGMSPAVISREHDVALSTVQAIRSRNLECPKHKPMKPDGVVDWRRTIFQQQFDEHGLPTTWPDINGVQRATKPLNLADLYIRLQQLSVEELRHIRDYQTLDGRSISTGILMYVQNLLDAMHYDAKIRLAAVKMISDRVHGQALQRIGNPDGTAVNPLLALIDVDKARLQPVDCEVQDDD